MARLVRNIKEKNVFEEIDLKLMLVNEQIKNHKRSIEKVKKMSGWQFPSGISGINYTKESTTNSVRISFAEGLRMIQTDEERIRELVQEQTELRRSKKRMKKIYANLAGTKAQVYYFRIICKMTQVVAAEKIPISVRQLQRIESSMREQGLI